MEYLAKTEVGKIRTNNEDCYFASDNIFLVADGMGGHNAGEIASKIASEMFATLFQDNFHKNTVLDKKFFNDIFQEINKKILKKSSSDPQMEGMGTTLTCAVILEKIAYISHVGDSRLYLFRDKKLQLKTEDHTIVGQLYKSGIITYEDTFSHPKRNFLTNVMGVSEEMFIDFFTIELLEGDMLLLCSDGLNAMLTDSLIEKIMIRSNHDLKKLSEKLIHTAIKKGGMDNITLILIKYD
jgi:PPM family protein phosphatase